MISRIKIKTEDGLFRICHSYDDWIEAWYQLEDGEQIWCEMYLPDDRIVKYTCIVDHDIDPKDYDTRLFH